jgi:hypothetical protein
MKLLAALIVSAIVLVPSSANADPVKFNRQAIVETFCSYPTLSLKGALEDCIEVAFEADSRGYDVPAIKRTTDRFTAYAIRMNVMTVSAYTNGRIQEFVGNYDPRR